MTLLLAVFELVLIVLHDLPFHYYAFYAIPMLHFIITFILLRSQN